MQRILASAIAALCLIAPAAHAATQPAVVFSGVISAASDGMSRGISETTGNPQGIVNLTLTHGPLYGGFLLKNVATPEGADSQHVFYVGLRGKVDGFQLNAQAYLRNNDGARPGTDHVFSEYQVDASRTFDNTTAKLLWMYSPDFYAATKSSSWVEASLSQKLTTQWSISGAYGHRSVTPKKDYNGWNFGATYSLRPKTLIDFRYYDTDEHHLGKPYVGRYLAMLTQKF